MKKGHLSLGKQALESGVNVLDDVSRGEDARRAVEGANKMGKKSTIRAPSVVRELSQGADLTASKKKKSISESFLNVYEQSRRI